MSMVEFTSPRARFETVVPSAVGTGVTGRSTERVNDWMFVTVAVVEVSSSNFSTAPTQVKYPAESASLTVTVWAATVGRLPTWEMLKCAGPPSEVAVTEKLEQMPASNLETSEGASENMVNQGGAAPSPVKVWVQGSPAP